MNAVTYADIAKACGVSKTTVCLALRNNPKISQRTRARICETADALNYRLNPLLSAHMSAMRTQKEATYQETVAMLTDWPLHFFKGDRSMFMVFYQGARERGHSLGFEVEILSLNEPGMTGRRMSQILQSRGIRGLLIAPLMSSEGNLDLDWDSFASVSLGYSLRKPGIHRACHDNYGTIREVCRLLKARGFQRIGLAMERRDDERVRGQWSGGFLSQQQYWGSVETVPLFVTEVWNRESFMKWFSEYKPEIVIGVGEQIAHWLRESNCCIPQDVSVISCATLPDTLSGTYQNFERLGASALEILSGLLYRNEIGIPSNPQQVLIGGVWLDGGTVAWPDER